MKNGQGYFFISFLLFFAISSVVFAIASSSSFGVKKSDFPPDFVFGAGTSALQVEGAALEDGRKPCIFDPFTHSHSDMIVDHSNGDIAADQYHKYKEDVKLMHDMGLDAYRFSISWPRLIPDGNGPVNPKGIQYYNNLIDELVSHGIEPHVTLYHFDLPLALQDEYEGLLSPKIIDDFTAYANVCFKEFGDRVKNWITFNEPNLEPIGGYNDGSFPPQRCSIPFGVCQNGDSTKEPYIVTHNILLSHLSASMLYKEKYKPSQGGTIGITIAAAWFEPSTNTQEDIDATQRAFDFQIGWFLDPLIYGDYPTVMKERVGSRLPSFTFEESRRLKNSSEFIGVNHYVVVHVRNEQNNFSNNERDFRRDMEAFIDGFLFGGKATVSAVRNLQSRNSSTTPWALVKVMNYLKVKYKNPPIVIYENGFGEYGIVPSTDGTNDEGRVEYLNEYIKATLQLVRNGSNIGGYFVWSLLDSFEFKNGYTARFGLIGVNFTQEDRRRYPKFSANWYAEFLNSNRWRTRASTI